MDFEMAAVSASAVSVNSIVGQSDSTSPRYKSLDHWRGLACLIVVVYHLLLPMCDQGLPLGKTSTISSVTSSEFEKTSVVPKSQPRTLQPKLRNIICHQLHIGVEMFFVISGYCITASAESTRRSGRTVREYFLRRLMRIFPPFWCALIGSVLICFAMDFINPG
jgi:hypothetical protein